MASQCIFTAARQRRLQDTTIFPSFLCQNHTPYLKFTDCLRQHHFFLATNIKLVSQTLIKDHAVSFYQKTLQLKFKIQHVFPPGQRRSYQISSIFRNYFFLSQLIKWQISSTDTCFFHTDPGSYSNIFSFVSTSSKTSHIVGCKKKAFNQLYFLQIQNV